MTLSETLKTLHRSRYAAARRIARNLKTATRARTATAARRATARIAANMAKLPPAADAWEARDAAAWAWEIAADVPVDMWFARVVQVRARAEA